MNINIAIKTLEYIQTYFLIFSTSPFYDKMKNMISDALYNLNSPIDWESISIEFEEFAKSCFKNIPGEHYELKAAIAGGSMMMHLIREAIKQEEKLEESCQGCKYYPMSKQCFSCSRLARNDLFNIEK